MRIKELRIEIDVTANEVAEAVQQYTLRRLAQERGGPLDGAWARAKFTAKEYPHSGGPVITATVVVENYDS